MRLEAAIRSQLLLQWFDRSVPLASGRWANERIPSTMHCFAVRGRGPAQIHQGFLEGLGITRRAKRITRFCWFDSPSPPQPCILSSLGKRIR